jgi:hypothetical protein
MAKLQLRALREKFQSKETVMVGTGTGAIFRERLSPANCLLRA